MAKQEISQHDWENFNAEALFPPPMLHTNHLTKVDKKEMTKVDPSDDGEISGDSNPEELGDTYSDAPIDKNHVDEMFEMEGSVDSDSADNREVKADNEIDKRTEELEQSNEQDAKNSSTGDEQKPEEKNAQPSDSNEEESESAEKEGAENPVQKESEGVEEVVEATDKTSEDVHGGDESTKDIEDSPNAADDGQNPENQGAESGEGGEDGEGDEGSGGGGKTEEESEPSEEKGEGEFSGNPLSTDDAEEWEAKADHSANALKLIDDLDQIEAKVRNEKGHRTGLPTYNFNREASPIELEIAFKKASELLKKFAAEEEITKRKDGSARWDAEKLVHSMITYRHQQIPSNKYEHPKEADICILLDISGSCAQQAEMFMAIAAGSIGSGVRVFVGYNGSCRACAMDQPKRPIRSYAQAKPWVQGEVSRVAGWDNQKKIGQWNFEQFLEEAQPKTVIVFGDWDGVDQYSHAIQQSRFKKIKFFWFANEGFGRRDGNTEDQIPEGFTKKNYIPGIFSPRDFVKALRVLK